MPQTFYTEEEVRKIEKNRDTLRRTLGHIEESYSYIDRSTQKLEETRYAYIPLSIDTFIDLLIKVREHYEADKKADSTPIYHLNFLEVGCGIGIKMLLASDILYGNRDHVYGIEINHFLASTARAMIHGSRITEEEHIFEEDAMLFQKYGDFDIIYYYCPQRDMKPQKRLELIIEEQMKKGAYLIYALKKDKSFMKKKKEFKIICGNEEFGVLQKK